jgi:hypothetical protein
MENPVINTGRRGIVTLMNLVMRNNGMKPRGRHIYKV